MAAICVVVRSKWTWLAHAQTARVAAAWAEEVEEVGAAQVVAGATGATRRASLRLVCEKGPGLKETGALLFGMSPRSRTATVQANRLDGANQSL